MISGWVGGCKIESDELTSRSSNSTINTIKGGNLLYLYSELPSPAITFSWRFFTAVKTCFAIVSDNIDHIEQTKLNIDRE